MSTLRIDDPATGETIAELPADDAMSIAAKVRKARAAQAKWAGTPLERRIAAIERFRSMLLAEQESLALTLTREVGKPIRQSRNELAGVLARIDFFTSQLASAIGDETVHAEPGLCEQITHPPLGVIANVSAWNYPYFVGANVFVAALLTGNAVLYKPSEHATLTGLEIARLLHASGVDPDVFQPIVGAGDAGAALIAQDVDGVYFTGSHDTGARIAAAVGPRMIRMQLELGGKDPSYVRADADARVAAASLADGAMYNTGQSCCSVERIYVHEDLHDAFVAHFLETVNGFVLGDPRAEDTYIGAITRAQQLDTLDAQARDAIDRGATLRCGGSRLPGPGNWYPPTVFTEVNHEMALMVEESFGPIIGIQRVSSDDQAVALMNDTRYGLTAGVFTRDEAAARALLSRVSAGSVYWNCCDRVSPRLPWSGIGRSGIGLTLSRYGIQAFTRPKAWHLRNA
ncbi:MAG: aldehyde dehydrogenase family protein [Burkholderiaceae bacterium]|nr:aldehyde dehydrogenase family protein [Burkholderiaceae bacterium]